MLFVLIYIEILFKTYHFKWLKWTKSESLHESELQKYCMMIKHLYRNIPSWTWRIMKISRMILVHISLITLKAIPSNSISLFNTQVDFRKCSMNIIDVLFPKKQYYTKLSPSLSRRILWRYITNFRYLDQNMISDDTIDGKTITQDNKYKCMGINLFNFFKNEASSVFIIKKGFRHLITEAIRNFSNCMSTRID